MLEKEIIIMTGIEAISLGIIQGITEFLPISSSGHLILAEYFMHIKSASIAFDVTLHIGTLISVLLYFWHDWIDMAGSIVPGRESGGRDRQLLYFLVIGTLPGAILGYLLEKDASTIFRSPWIVATTLSGFAIVLWLAERMTRRTRSLEELGWKDALAIGMAQALAIVPGVSRSGITMTMALFLGFKRETAAKFSFLLSCPIIAGAGFYEGLKLWHTGLGSMGMDYLQGFIASVLCGYMVIAFLMRYLTKHTFYIFVYYRLIIALVVAMVLVSGH